MVSREDKARVCEMYANGSKYNTISSALCLSYETVKKIILRNYIGKVYSKTPILLTLQSKV